MPIYVYHCPTCSNDFERKGFMFESHLMPDCPECGKTVERNFLAEFEGIQFIGPTKTLGSLKDKNTGKFSEDYKHHLTNLKDNKELE